MARTWTRDNPWGVPVGPWRVNNVHYLDVPFEQGQDYVDAGLFCPVRQRDAESYEWIERGVYAASDATVFYDWPVGVKRARVRIFEMAENWAAAPPL